MHESQSMFDGQVSIDPPPHALESQSQSMPEQEPSVAPLLVPRWQLPVSEHQPQT